MRQLGANGLETVQPCRILHQNLLARRRIRSPHGELVQQVGGKTGTALLLYIKGNEPTPEPEATPDVHFCNNVYHGCNEHVDVDGQLCGKCEKDGGWYYATRPATEKGTEALCG